MGRWFGCGYERECDGCGALIEVGDQARYDNEGNLLCENCGEEVGDAEL